METNIGMWGTFTVGYSSLYLYDNDLKNNKIKIKLKGQAIIKLRDLLGNLRFI